MNNLIVKPGIIASLLRAVGLVKVDPDGKVSHSAGADFIEDTPFKAGYDPSSAMSALAAFPWPFAAVQAISTDLSKVPLRAYRGRGSEAEVLDTHPVLELLSQPSSRVNGVLFRRQLYTDLVLSGNAFCLMAGSAGRVDALIRMHPARVKISPLSDGQPDKYQYESGHGQPALYEHEQVLHIRGPSWSDDPTNLWGIGAVQPLHNDLTTEKAQAALAARTAATGQPTGILSPKEDGDRWSREQIGTLRDAYEKQMRAGGSGVLILGGQAQFDKLQITPREMEFSQVRDFVRASTIAAFGCVPVRLGLETANYSQSRNQLQLYWESLQGRAALVDSELTRLARMLGDEDVVIKHDFSEVESLQESRSERLNRVMEWTMLGVSAADAAAYEGFDDLPLTQADEEPAEIADDNAEPTEIDGQTEAPTDEPLAATALNGAQIASLLQILSSVAMGAITFDAALALISVAFPTISESSAREILAGAQAVDDPDAPTEQSLTEARRALYDDIDFSVPEGVKAELKRGLEWHDEGLSGDGLVPATVSWARRMANGEDISPEKAVKMRAWLARHKSDKTGEGFSPGEEGYPSPGRVAWALWGGDPAVSWSEKLVGQMENTDKGITKQIEDTLWRAWADDIHSPSEKALQLAILRYFKGYASRIAKRLPQVISKKTASGDIVLKAELDEGWLDTLLDAYAEGQILDDAIRDVVSDAWKRGAEAAVDDMPDEIEFVYDHDETDKKVDEQLGEMIGVRPDGKGGYVIADKSITATTRKNVRRIILSALDAGDTIADMQKQIMQAPSFNASRALKIARTESTKSINAAGVNAWEQMADEAGVELELKWKAQPGAREEHAALNGKVRGDDGFWEIDGAKASAPGGFGVAGLDINCRCTFLPSVKI